MTRTIASGEVQLRAQLFSSSWHTALRLELYGFGMRTCSWLKLLAP